MDHMWNSDRVRPGAAHYDVIVCGGGPAGWVAAVSAARSGCRTALIERYGFLGGTAVAGLVSPLSGCWFQGNRVVDGITWEFVEKLTALDAAQVELPKGHISFHPEYYKLVAQSMVLDADVELMTNTWLIDAESEGDRVKSVLVSNKSGIFRLEADCFIDATGDGDLCHLADVPMLEPAPEGLQPASLCFLLEGVDTETELLRHCIRHNGRDGRASCNEPIRRLLQEKYPHQQFGGPWFNTLHRGGCLTVNITRAAVDATDARAFTKAEHRLRRDMFALVEILRQEFPEFKNCQVVSSAVNAGIRETRRIRGMATMTAEDVAESKKPECPVAHLAHPMDIHAAKGAGQILIKLTRDVYIPFDTMVCREKTNLMAAGRCMSIDREPYASARVMGTLMAAGECAGIAAGLQKKLSVPAALLPRDRLNAEISLRKPFI